MKSIQVSVLVVALLFSGAASVFAEEPAISADEYLKRAEKFLQDGREFQAVMEFREAIGKGIKSAEVHGYLSVLLYELGFIDDAIKEMREAVDLFPESVYLNMELGKLYFAGNSAADAMEQFFSVLEMNPGHANAYYYLGEQFLRMKEYDMAWLSAKMARRLGHRGQGLISKLSDLSDELKVVPWKKPGKELYIRQILVDTREKAEELVNRISEGEFFENIAARELTGLTAEKGGFLGMLDPSDVHPRIVGELLNEDVLSGPFIVETEKGYHIVQRVMPFDYSHWEELLAEHKSPDRKAGKKEKAELVKGEGGYLVRVGAFKNKKNALSLTGDLKELGFPSYQYQEGDWYYVIAGRYENSGEARKAGKKVATHGYEFYIYRIK